MIVAIPSSSFQTFLINDLAIFSKGGDFMERLESPRPVTPKLESVNPAKAVVEDASNPPTHPLRRGGWLRSVTDPVLRGTEELAMVTGRVEKV